MTERVRVDELAAGDVIVASDGGRTEILSDPEEVTRNHQTWLGVRRLTIRDHRGERPVIWTHDSRYDRIKED